MKGLSQFSNQAGVALFFLLVTKDSSNPVLLKLVLQGLASEWQVDEELLMRKIELTTKPVDGASSEGVGGPDLLRQSTRSSESPQSPALSPDIHAQLVVTRSPTPDLCSLGSSAGLCRSGTPSGWALEPPSTSTGLSSSWSSQKSGRISIRQVARQAAGRSIGYLTRPHFLFRTGCQHNG